MVIGATVLVMMVITGHQGATITHGENFLTAPLQSSGSKAIQVSLADAQLYEHLVKPIFQAKCMGCHNNRKMKGELSMETAELLLKGGKSGALWEQNGTGLLLDRLHLPLAEEKHMPPAGKPQLSSQEMQIIRLWLKGGADTKGKVADLPETDSLRVIAAARFKSAETEQYNFPAASESVIKSLNNDYRAISPTDIHSPALNVEFFSALFYQPQALKDLLKIKQQVVSLNLNKMPVTDEELKTIAQFTSLRRLNLSFTDITGSALGELKALSELKQLSLAGTNVKKADVEQLSALKNLKQVYLWHTGLSEADFADLSNALKPVIFENGYVNDTAVLKLPAPIIKNEDLVIKSPVALEVKHYIKGAEVRYTVDGTVPDSLNSPLYDPSVMLSKGGTVKVKAFKKGWASSDVAEASFFLAAQTIDSLAHLLPPDKSYQNLRDTILYDKKTGDAGNFKSGEWVAWRYGKMETVLMFKEPLTTSSITLSTLINIGSYIMPPASVEVWGGNDLKALKKLAQIVPTQPEKMEATYAKGYALEYAPVKVKYLKVKATPLPKLPAWHPGKGDSGWLFVDEIFVN
jgi:hypothetical protein